MFSFREPLFLLLLLVTPLLVWALFLRKGRVATAPLGDITRGRALAAGRIKAFFTGSLLVLAWVLAVIAFAGPRSGKVFEQRLSEGVDIMLALDISGSMNSVDVPPEFFQGMQGPLYHDREKSLTNRLANAKHFIKDFVSKRRDDRFGLVVFGGYSYTRCPLTFDHALLLGIIDQVDFADVDSAATAIGLALANSVQRLIKSTAKSRVVILLTDGDNNAGEIDPMTAAGIAKTMGVKVYTIGVGSDTPLFPRGTGGYYVKAQFVLDEETLKKIAAETGGQYFRVKEPKTLSDIFAKIDNLEKSRIEKRVFVEHRELFQPFLLGALILILAAWLFRNVVFRMYP